MLSQPFQTIHSFRRAPQNFAQLFFATRKDGRKILIITLYWWTSCGKFCLLKTFPTIGKHQIQIHPGRLTWNLRIHPWKRKKIFQTIIFRFHVKLQGCNLLMERNLASTTSSTLTIPLRVWKFWGTAHMKSCKLERNDIDNPWWTKHIWY